MLKIGDKFSTTYAETENREKFFCKGAFIGLLGFQDSLINEINFTMRDYK